MKNCIPRQKKRICSQVSTLSQIHFHSAQRAWEMSIVSNLITGEGLWQNVKPNLVHYYIREQYQKDSETHPGLRAIVCITHRVGKTTGDTKGTVVI